MKFYLTILSLVFIMGNVNAETAAKKVDRTAQEAVDEVKLATKKIVGKIKKNTNSKTDEGKKKDLKE